LTKVVDILGRANVAAEVRSADEMMDVASRLHPDVAIVDLDLSPSLSLVTDLHLACPETRIIVMADRTRGDAAPLVKALASGAAGAIYKDGAPDDLVHALKSSSREAPVVPQEATGLLLSSYLEAMSEKRHRDVSTIEALAAALEVRDFDTGQHVHRVTDLACRCLGEIDSGLANNEEVAYGFLLHDVGKIGVPDAILNKPGPLSSGEWDVMRRHPEMGVRIVGPIGFSAAATGVILCHHEHWDGGGYPYGLSGEKIPVSARAFSVADTYDAMTSDRPYREAVSSDEAVDTIKSHAQSLFDPDVVDVFVDLVDEYAS
jgi:response regulator RpfG family c-di-GMP phosphodiesterase